jgi:hypothetical protein
MLVAVPQAVLIKIIIQGAKKMAEGVGIKPT